MDIKSQLVSLTTLVENEYFFNIPIYQRLYVWEEEQVKTLLEDLKLAFEEKKELFYLGGVLLVENDALSNDAHKVYDLIDGQQRFTTLWMIALMFQGELTPFIEQKGTNRIHFAIRDEVNRKFRSFIEGNQQVQHEFPSHITNALAIIQTYATQFEEEEAGKAAKIASFIYEKVQLVCTEVPINTDLNKLFEVINNRGVQLQHHEILKARLLDKLQPKDRLKYSSLWDACAVMDQYIEKTIKAITGIKTRDLFENEEARAGMEKLANPAHVLQAIEEKDERTDEPKSLLEILSSTFTIEAENDHNDDEEDMDQVDVRSIITFPMLLQHTLRIYLVNKKHEDIPKISDKELLTIFSNHFLSEFTEDEPIKEFIELLWEVRYAFDKHVIKWVGPKEHETHSIRQIYKARNKQYYTLQRMEPTLKGQALLQSMLYHSQQITTHYWLTPYLSHLIKNKGQNSYDYLKHLDNHLLCADRRNDEPLIVRTRKFLENPYMTTTLSTDILLEKRGTDFPHYWFYKLEYVLWEKFASSKDKRWSEFKLTAKNSVEHISPQTQKDTDLNTISKDNLDSFGNLALVSRSINSEYSNLPFNEKRQRFINNNRDKFDSLKMALIYLENETWNDQLAQQHQADMIQYLNEYLGI